MALLGSYSIPAHSCLRVLRDAHAVCVAHAKSKLRFCFTASPAFCQLGRKAFAFGSVQRMKFHDSFFRALAFRCGLMESHWSIVGRTNAVQWAETSFTLVAKLRTWQRRICAGKLSFRPSHPRRRRIHRATAGRGTTASSCGSLGNSAVHAAPETALVFPAALFTAHGYRAEADGPRVSPAVVGNSQGALKGDGQGRERGVVPSSGAQGGFDLVRRQGQHPEAMPILRRPVEPAESPARLQLREPSGAFLGTQELGRMCPIWRSTWARSGRAISGNVSERRSSARWRGDRRVSLRPAGATPDRQKCRARRPGRRRRCWRRRRG